MCFRAVSGISAAANTPALLSELSAGPLPGTAAIKPVGAGSVVQITQGRPDWLTQKRRAQPAALICFVVHHQTSTIQGHFISLMLCRVMASLAKCVICSLIRSAKSDQPVSSYTCFMRGGSPASSNAGSEIVVWRNLIKVPTLPRTLFPLSPFLHSGGSPPRRICMPSTSGQLFCGPPFTLHSTRSQLCVLVCVSSSPTPPQPPHPPPRSF